jgi:hypothetical protein
MSVDELRTHAGQILNSARASDTILARLADRGYDDTKLTALQGHLDAFTDAARRFDALRADREAASQTFTDTLDAFRRGRFREHVGIADSAFTGDAGARSALNLDDGLDNLSVGYATWRSQAVDFYTEILSDDDLSTAVAAFNLTPDELQDGLQEIEAIDALRQAREAYDSERQQARRDRDALRDVLETELRQFQKLSQVVLRETPEMLERLGYVVPSN